MEPCILWDKYRDRNGYGRVGIKGKVRFAHRVAYESAYGPLASPKIHVHHICENPACVNVDHLVAVTEKLHGAITPRPRGSLGHVAAINQTHCAHGHEFTPENTYIRLSGSRCCRRCNARRVAESKQRKMAA